MQEFVKQLGCVLWEFLFNGANTKRLELGMEQYSYKNTTITGPTDNLISHHNIPPDNPQIIPEQSRQPPQRKQQQPSRQQVYSHPPHSHRSVV
jgi:hypothetical protein